MIRRPPRSTLFPYRRSSDLSGAIARFSPVMGAVAAHARAGGPVLGICNGFQILCEAGLLPGGLMRNARLRSEEHTSELQSRLHLVCRLLLEKKKREPRTATM